MKPTAYEETCLSEIRHWMAEKREAQLDHDERAERKAQYMLNTWSDRLDRAMRQH